MNADALLRSFAEPIAVVGNGMMTGMRDPIEAHATIIRLNNFVGGFEPDIGHRCDAWCVNCHTDVKFREWSKPVFTVVSHEDDCGGIDDWTARYPQMSLPDRSWIRDAREMKSLNPSTGLTLLHRMMRLKLDFTAFGFDGMRGGHYWNPAHRHNHPDEFLALIEMAKSGVRFK